MNKFYQKIRYNNIKFPVTKSVQFASSINFIRNVILCLKTKYKNAKNINVK